MVSQVSTPITCSICLDDIECKKNKLKNAITLPCNHTFHKNCFGEWDKRTPQRKETTCPYCRFILVKKEKTNPVTSFFKKVLHRGESNSSRGELNSNETNRNVLIPLPVVETLNITRRQNNLDRRALENRRVLEDRRALEVSTPLIDLID